ncbi:protein of unknown function (plasmid) [Azospirillum baldaniorum]|uniref:Peptidoglycan binding-like domain-containing protein n=1 Tax=Azospirillum baldaniorum TaxID=1064539 RepID=A0A9P1NS71_9PROT|nr:protein of unknown function [Azospirillum baldaniorum]
MLTACDPARDNSFRVGGAGLDLHTSQTDETTANLTNYFQNLCAQTGFDNEKCAPEPTALDDARWSLLVETGYNDIDARCDQYLRWIDEKRTERMLVEGTGTALGTLLAGVLGIAEVGTSTIAYTALALGFTRTAYDNYNNSILLGLEGSTIKEIVNRQRAAHRKEFANRKYQTRPQAVFALRRYLMFCTPQTILTDVNTFSREAASGNTAGIESKARAAAQIIPTANSPAVPPTRNVPIFTTKDNVALIFDGPGFTNKDVVTVQSGSCLAADGIVGNETKAAVRIIEDTFGSQMGQNGKINDQEWSLVEQALQANCPSKLMNFYEDLTYGRGHNPGYGGDLVEQLIKKNKFPPNLSGKDLRSKEVRDEVAKLRSSERINESYPGYDVRNQVTPKFVHHFGL